MCPRCDNTEIHVLAHAPVADAWQVLQCTRCLYTWRTTEPPRRTQPELYPEQFRMTDTDINTAPEVPAIPPLHSTDQHS